MTRLLNRIEVSVTLANKEKCDRFVVDWFTRNRLSHFDISDSMLQEISQILQDFIRENEEVKVPKYDGYPYVPIATGMTNGICTTF